MTFNRIAAGIISVASSTAEPELKRSEFVEMRLLNPQIPVGIRDDPDGMWHFDRGVADPDGNPIPNIKKGQRIQLSPRPYQAQTLDDPAKYKALRWGRRTGKSFLLAIEAVVECLTNPTAQILVVTPNESQIKVLFDDYIRPLIYKGYLHKGCGAAGIQRNASGRVPDRHDFVVTKDTQKPQEIVVEDGKGHRSAIRGMVVSNSARGQSATLVIVDESDFAKNDWLMAVVTPIMTTTPATRMMVSSTPSGSRESFFFNACNGNDFKEFRVTFRELPHWTPELEERVARLVGGIKTNAFKQEYLAEWGDIGQGLFSQQALNDSLIVAPYIRLAEDIHDRTGERTALLTAGREIPEVFANYRTAADRYRNPFVNHNTLGAESIWYPGCDPGGRITAGTDWNEHAGMQTVVIWWPSRAYIQSGKLKVARYDYAGTEPVMSGRAKDSLGAPREFTVGSDNGDPGGRHDLSNARGIVIWHGRLENQQDFNWLLAANRAAAMMGIPNFIDAWYVDHGYGRQIIQKIEGILQAGEYDADMVVLRKHYAIESEVLDYMRAFLSENEDRAGAKIFKPVDFAIQQSWDDPHGEKRSDSTKELLYELATISVLQKTILFPAAEVEGYAKSEELGDHYYVAPSADGDGFEETGRIHETDKDLMRATGLAEPKGVGTTAVVTYGGLVSQMRTMQISRISDRGRRVYEGIDHGVDAFALAVYAYESNFAAQHAGSIFRPVEESDDIGVADDIYTDPDKGDVATRAPKPTRGRMESRGGVATKVYDDPLAPLQAILDGKLKPENAGASLEQALKAGQRHLKSWMGGGSKGRSDKPVPGWTSGGPRHNSR